MRAVNASASPKQTFSLGLHSSVVADVESSSQDVVEVFMDDDVAGKEVAVRSLDPQTHRLKDVLLTISQVSEVQKQLGAVSRKREDDLLQSRRANKYQ